MIDGGRRLAILMDIFIPATSLSFSNLSLPENRFNRSTVDSARLLVRVGLAISFAMPAWGEVRVNVSSFGMVI
jgi:hypothetical protein